MNSDFRISVSLATHPKALKLMRKCGDIAFYNLVRFWSYVAQNKPDGDITGLDCDDIEIASGWVGECSNLYQALLDLRFIEFVDKKLVVHDWSEHNGYACHAKERSEKAKKAASARWGGKNNATSNTQAMLNNATSDAPAPTPSPTPSPTPNELIPPIVPQGGKGSVLKSYQYPDWLNLELWADFHRMRSRIKKPITTKRTIDGLLKNLDNIITQGHNQDDVIQSAIAGCWQKFYPPKNKGKPTAYSQRDKRQQEQEEMAEYYLKTKYGDENDANETGRPDDNRRFITNEHGVDCGEVES